MFEISVVDRDFDGNPKLDANGNIKRRYFKSEDADKIATFWHQNSNKKRKRKSKAASGKEVKKALNSIESHIQKREKRKEKKANFDDSENQKRNA